MEIRYLLALTGASLGALVIIHQLATRKAARKKQGQLLIVASLSVLLAVCGTFAALTGVAQAHKKSALLAGRGEDALLTIEIYKSIADDSTDTGVRVLDLDTSKIITEPSEIATLGSGSPIEVETFSGVSAEIELTQNEKEDYQVLVRHDGVLIESRALTFPHRGTHVTVTEDDLEWANGYPTLISDELKGWLQ